MIRSACLFLLLAFSLLCLAADVEPSSSVLVARQNLSDPNFHDSVVLLTQRGRLATLGLILNRPTETPLTRVFPDIAALWGREDKLFFGGPVDTEDLVAIFRAPARPDDAIEIFEGIYMTSKEELLRELLAHPGDFLRVFAGHASWVPGQLELEIGRGDWQLTRAGAKALFESKPDNLWPEFHRRASVIMTRYRMP